MNELDKLERDWHAMKKCPQCHTGEMTGLGVAIGRNSYQTCNRCGFKRPYSRRSCEICNKTESVSNFVVSESTILHKDPDCRRKSLEKTNRKNKPNPVEVEAIIRNQAMERVEFFSFLATLTFEEIDSLWNEQAWLDPSNIPGTSRLSEDYIRENIEKARRAKYKNTPHK